MLLIFLSVIKKESVLCFGSVGAVSNWVVQYMPSALEMEESNVSMNRTKTKNLGTGLLAHWHRH